MNDRLVTGSPAVEAKLLSRVTAVIIQAADSHYGGLR